MFNPLALMSNRLLAAVQPSPSTRPCLKFHKYHLPCGLSDAAGKKAKKGNKKPHSTPGGFGGVSGGLSKAEVKFGNLTGNFCLVLRDTCHPCFFVASTISIHFISSKAKHAFVKRFPSLKNSYISGCTIYSTYCHNRHATM